MVVHREEARLKLQGQGQLIEWPTGCWQLHEAAREVKRFAVRFDQDRSRRFMQPFQEWLRYTDQHIVVESFSRPH